VYRHRGEELRYIEVTRDDLRLANELTHEVLGRSLDELPPQTRRLLELVETMVQERTRAMGIERRDFRFSRREVREATGYSYEQLRVHLGRLVEMEYVVAHRGNGHSQRLGYELVYVRGAGDGPFLPGLIGADELGAHEYDGNRSGLEANRSGQNEDRSGPGRPRVGGQSGRGRGNESEAIEDKTSSIRDRDQREQRKAHPGNGKSSRVVAMPSVAAPARAVS
jgi:hypothetical protein